MNLIEMIAAMVIVGILAGVVALPIQQGVDLWSLIQFREDAVARGRLALERAAREMTWVREDLNERSVLIATSSWFEFFSGLPGNPRKKLVFESGQLKLGVFVSGAWKDQVLADNVTGIGVTSRFTYYNVSNNVIAAPLIEPAAPNNPLLETDIWRIQIQITVSSGTQQVTLQRTVYPRSFLRERK